ncbi:MAG: holin family protein [Pseudomonadota bacterium]
MSWFARIFGGGISGVGKAMEGVAEVFTENTEKGAQRAHDLNAAVLAQFAAEFARPSRGLFDRFVDGLNRLPRPVMALGTIGLMIYAMNDPIGFAARMQGLQLVPEELWWLFGAIVSFYFGARELHKTRRARGRSDVAAVVQGIKQIEELLPTAPTTSSVVMPATAELTISSDPMENRPLLEALAKDT